PWSFLLYPCHRRPGVRHPAQAWDANRAPTTWFSCPVRELEMQMPLEQIRNRTNLLKGYFAAEKDFPIAFGETLARGVLKLPCTAIGPRYISRIVEAGEYQQVYFRGIEPPLFWPTRLGLFDLYKAA